MTQTNKPLVFLRLTPVLLPVALLASVFMITACGGGKSKAVPAPPAPAFTSRVIEDVPTDIQSDITNIFSEYDGITRTTLIDTLGRNYLEDLSIDIPRGAELETLALQGAVGNAGLSPQDGFLMTFIRHPSEVYAHIVVGMFDKTHTGNPVSADATFTGTYTIRLSAFSDEGEEINEPIDAQPITLNLNFRNNTLKGEAETQGGARLEVDGVFATNNLSGNVMFRERNGRRFEAPLTGLIGQDGAVGIFASHNDSEIGTKYSLGGGFVVEPVADPEPAQ